MMYTSKGKHAVVMFLLLTLSHGNPFRQRYNPVISPLSWHIMPPSEYMLREIILKSVTPSPSPLDANAPHKRPLDASYYGGPIAAYSNDDENVILSRGNVYRLLNGHWMLCQDGCIDCEPCAAQRNPLFTWILQRIKQPLNSKPTRHNLQLMLIPQASDHFHASNLWPNYYVYVTPRGDRTSTIRAQHDNDSESPLPGLENSFSEHHRRSKDSWLMERDLNADQDGILQEDNRATVQENVSTEKTEEEGSIERKHGFGNMRPRPQPRLEKAAEEVNQLTPRLILGTDQKGQKHLVHVVPADYPTTTTISFLPDHPTSQSVEDQVTRLNNTIPKREKQTYQLIFRRIFDSLNTHRRPIENFLELTDNVDDHRLSSSTDNMEVSGFSWNNRDINHKNFDPLHLNDALLSSSYAGNEDRMEKHQQHRNRYDHMKQNNNYYTAYQSMNQAEMSRSQSQSSFNLDLDGQRRRVRIKPYFVNSNNISTINSVSSQKLDNHSGNVIQKSGPNDFVINPTKQTDFNDAFIEKANNNFMESSSITTKRENGQLFDLERQESGDVNREFEASHHAFKVIVTTESPVIQSERETLNRTTVLQITTLKTFANSS